MSRKDYQLIAGVINSVVNLPEGTVTTPEAVVASLTVAMAAALKAENSAFNTDRFLAACTK